MVVMAQSLVPYLSFLAQGRYEEAPEHHYVSKPTAIQRPGQLERMPVPHLRSLADSDNIHVSTVFLYL
jgi:hypothetical protein